MIIKQYGSLVHVYQCFSDFSIERLTVLNFVKNVLQDFFRANISNNSVISKANCSTIIGCIHAFNENLQENLATHSGGY